MLTDGARRAALPRVPITLDLPVFTIGVAVLLTATALIVLPPIFGVVLVVGAIGVTLVFARPQWGFYLLLLSIPVQDTGARGELTLTNALFGLTVVAWLARRATTPGQPRPRSAVGPAFCLFVAALALSLTVARELTPGFAALFQWIKAWTVYFLALDFLRTRRDTVLALSALLLAAAGEGAYGLVQYLTGAGPASFAVGAQFSRAYGTFGRPNSYAGYLEMVFPPAIVLTGWLWLTMRRGSPTAAQRLLALAAAAATTIIGGAILASFSRGAWLGTAGALGVMLLLASPRSRAAAAVGTFAVGLLALAGGAMALPASIRSRFDSILGNFDSPEVQTAYITAENFAVVERKAHWVAGLNMFETHRFLGIGLGNFNVRYTEFNVSPTFLISQGHAHNYYIHVAAEAGLVGLGAYLLLLAAIVFTGLRALYTIGSRDPIARALVVAALGTITAVAIHNIFENLHVLSLGIQLSTIWALPAIVARPGWAGDDTAGSVTHEGQATA